MKGFSALQKVGQAFMLPVAVLPVAGLFLGIGSIKGTLLQAYPDNVGLVNSLNHGIGGFILDLLANAGSAIFGILPLIFAIAVAIGFTKREGTSALAALVGYFVMLGTMQTLAPVIGVTTGNVLGFQTIDLSVLGGIAIGAVAAYVYNKYNNIQLPEYLAFFGGRRFVPIMTAFLSMGVGLFFALIWRYVGPAIDSFSAYVAYKSPTVAFVIYEAVQRALIPTGLHHIWNVPFFFQIGSFVDPITQTVVHGDIPRYLAGDPTAGYLAGGYMFKMFGLPAAAIAIALRARPSQRKYVMSIMISAAATSFLTGITEPIEFSFLFVAPILYGVHIVLAAAGYLLTGFMNIHFGTTFSQGFIDFLVLFSKSTNGLLLFLEFLNLI